MKYVILVLALLLSAGSASFAQNNAIARIKYEKAEEAFATADYKTSVALLDETTDLLGSTNPRILYLRIMAQKQMIQKAPLGDFGLLQRARKDCEFYLSNYGEVPGNEAKFREIYDVSEALTKYPKTTAAFEKAKLEEARKREAEEAEKAKLAKASAYVEGLAKKYKFQPGLTISEFKKLNPEVVSIMSKANKSELNGSISYMNAMPIGAPNPQGPSSIYIDKNGIVNSYIHVISTEKNASEKYNNLLDKLKQEWSGNIDETFITEKIANSHKHIFLSIPGSRITVSAYVIHYRKWSALTIYFSSTN